MGHKRATWGFIGDIDQVSWKRYRIIRMCLETATLGMFVHKGIVTGPARKGIPRARGTANESHPPHRYLKIHILDIRY